MFLIHCRHVVVTGLPAHAWGDRLERVPVTPEKLSVGLTSTPDARGEKAGLKHSNPAPVRKRWGLDHEHPQFPPRNLKEKPAGR